MPNLHVRVDDATAAKIKRYAGGASDFLRDAINLKLSARSAAVPSASDTGNSVPRVSDRPDGFLQSYVCPLHKDADVLTFWGFYHHLEQQHSGLIAAFLRLCAKHGTDNVFASLKSLVDMPPSNTKAVEALSRLENLEIDA